MIEKIAITPTTAIISPIKVEAFWGFTFDGSVVCAVTVRMNVEM